MAQYPPRQFSRVGGVVMKATLTLILDANESAQIALDVLVQHIAKSIRGQVASGGATVELHVDETGAVYRVDGDSLEAVHVPGRKSVQRKLAI